MQRVEGLASGRIPLDDQTRRRAALVVVDDLAAMVAGAREPEVERLSSQAARRAVSGESLHVTGLRSERSWAALVNAVAANWNELDEGYRPATCHGGLYALPAALAEVEASGGSVGDLLVALVVGYEVATAYARALPPERPLVLHPHATLSPIGAAAAVSCARGEEGPGIESAVAVAATFAAVGPFRHATEGVLARNAWAGHGAMAGFTAAEMAQAGIGADASAAFTVLHECLGYPVNEDELAHPPTRWAIHDGYHKSYACCQYAHSAVEAALELVTGPLSDVPSERITDIVVSAHPLALPLASTAPSTVLGGKFSVPHSVGAVLAQRSTQHRVFSGSLLDDPEVARLRACTRLEPYDGDLVPPHDRPSRVTVTIDSGEVFEAECLSAVGGPDRPLTEGDVLEKAALLTERSAPRFSGLAEQLVTGDLPATTAWAAVLEEMWSR
jgi:2-methylcitrate dehydratase PrpD